MKSKTINNLTAFCKSLIPNKNDKVLGVFSKVFASIIILSIAVFLFPLTISLFVILFLSEIKFKSKVVKISTLIIVGIVCLSLSMAYWTRDVEVRPSVNIASSEKIPVLTADSSAEDIAVLLERTKTKIKELNDNLERASNYNVDVTNYAEVATLGVTDNSSAEEIQNAYTQVSVLNSELIASINVAKAQTYQVVEVVDGDTIKIMYEGTKETVRLIGIDTPETVDPNQPVGCFGKEASNKMVELVSGKNVKIMFDSSQGARDKYGRLLLYVWINNTFVNELMVKEGYAHEYTYSTPYLYQSEFKNAQKIASESKSGLWGNVCSCEKKEVSNKCSACKKSTITHQNWDCTTYTESVTNNNCTSGCSTVTVTPKVNTGYSCNCSKTCTQISSCAEAYYQLNTCGCSKRDGDSDGVPCEELCN